MEYLNKHKINTDSLKKRYLFKLGSSFIDVPINLIITTVVIRSLGPATYGNFTFLTQFFTKIVNFFDSGTSAGFYTKLSNRLNERGLIKFYWYLVLILCLMALIFVSLVLIFNKQSLFWPGQSIIYIWLALIFSLLTWFSNIVIKIVDAYGYTVKGEILKIMGRILGLVLVLILFFIEKLNLKTYFFYYYIFILIIIIGSGSFLRKYCISLYPNIKLKSEQIKMYTKEFWSYSHPLITYSVLGLLVGILDVWMLQKFAGSVQQGFYGLAIKISSICFIFASSMTPLIMREFSIAFGNKDMYKMRDLFSHFIPLIYSLISFLVIFISVNGEKIALLFGGNEYFQSKEAISIMVLYPMHQTYGQLSGSIFFATGQTKLYRNIGVIFMLVSLPLTYILLAPSSSFGFGLGATGLSIKMVAIQFIAVNVQLFYNAKFLRISFFKLFSHQIYTAVIFVIIAYFSSFIANNIYTNKIIISIFINIIIYVILSMCLLFSFPFIFSLTRKELNKYIILLKNKNPFKIS